jgi:hypothetical protein
MSDIKNIDIHEIYKKYMNDNDIKKEILVDNFMSDNDIKKEILVDNFMSDNDNDNNNDNDFILNYTTNKHTTNKHTTNKHTTNEHTTNENTTNEHTTNEHTTNENTTNENTTNEHTTNEHMTNENTSSEDIYSNNYKNDITYKNSELKEQNNNIDLLELNNSIIKRSFSEYFYKLYTKELENINKNITTSNIISLHNKLTKLVDGLYTPKELQTMKNINKSKEYIFYDYINKDKHNKYGCIVDQNKINVSVKFGIEKNECKECNNTSRWIFSCRECSNILKREFNITKNNIEYCENRYGMLSILPSTKELSMSIAYIEEDKYLSYLLAKSFNWRIPKIYYAGSGVNYDLPYLPETCCIKKCHGHSGDSVKCIKNNICVSDYCEFYCKEFTINDFHTIYDNSKVIIEELVNDKTDETDKKDEILETKTNDKSYKIPCDYRLYVFNGEIEFIFIWKWDETNFHVKQVACYDSQFNKIKDAVIAPYITNNFNDSDDYIPNIKSWCILKKYCEALKFKTDLFMRVDFYIVEDEVIFGELCKVPFNGLRHSKNFLKLASDIMIKHKFKYVDYWKNNKNSNSNMSYDNYNKSHYYNESSGNNTNDQENNNNYSKHNKKSNGKKSNGKKSNGKKYNKLIL